MSAARSLSQVFRWPLVLGLLTCVGLISALVADGIWDGLSWLLLLIPVAIGIVRGCYSRS